MIYNRSEFLAKLTNKNKLVKELVEVVGVFVHVCAVSDFQWELSDSHSVIVFINCNIFSTVELR